MLKPVHGTCVLTLSGGAITAAASDCLPIYEGPSLREIRKTKSPNPKRENQRAAKAARKRNKGKSR